MELGLKNAGVTVISMWVRVGTVSCLIPGFLWSCFWKYLNMFISLPAWQRKVILWSFSHWNQLLFLKVSQSHKNELTEPQSGSNFLLISNLWALSQPGSHAVYYVSEIFIIAALQLSSVSLTCKLFWSFLKVVEFPIKSSPRDESKNIKKKVFNIDFYKFTVSSWEATI